jgi:hypothetical protein
VAILLFVMVGSSLPQYCHNAEPSGSTRTSDGADVFAATTASVETARARVEPLMGLSFVMAWSASKLACVLRTFFGHTSQSAATWNACSALAEREHSVMQG